MPLFLATVVLAAVGFLLRLMQLRYVFDDSGLPVSGSGLTFALVVVCCAAALLLLLGCGGIPKREEFARNFGSNPTYFALTCLAALGLLVGSAAGVWSAIPGPGEALSVVALLPSFCGVLAALCIFMAASGCRKGAKPITALYLIPFFFLIVRLIVDFKWGWSSDPIILDYCFDLFAVLSAMTAAYHLAGFCFDKGHRARTSFWCLMSTVFCATACADGGLADCLTYAALALWFLVSAWQLLGPAVPQPKTEETAAENPNENTEENEA
jgi:hypothetical protein